MKRLLLSLLSAGMVALIFSSYGSGPWNGGAGNRTGSAGPGTADCSGSTCHAPNSGTTWVTLVVLDSTNSPIPSYVPGATYEVVVGGSNTNQLPEFGFQATCVRKLATTIQAGTFSSKSTDISVRTNTSPNLVEHNTPILSTPGSLNVYIARFNWTAPPAGTGTVLFYATLCAVDGTGGSGGDQPSTLSFPTEITEATTRVTNVALMPLQLFPNPASGEINAHLGSNASTTCTVRVSDLTGKTVLFREASITHGIATINTQELQPGIYSLYIKQGTLGYGASFVKQ